VTKLDVAGQLRELDLGAQHRLDTTETFHDWRHFLSSEFRLGFHLGELTGLRNLGHPLKIVN
jgi:hypothetical protein